MMNIIVAFPKAEQAKHIRHILVKGGYTVQGMCTTAAKALQLAHELGEGIVICGARFVDHSYQELYQDLPAPMQMLLLAAPNFLSQRHEEGLVCLAMPLKVQALLQTVEMMEYDLARKRRRSGKQPKRRTEAEEILISQAKERLMEQNHMTEQEAYRYMQKSSMDSGTGMAETARMVLCMLPR